ncbi:MAG: DUF2752 domain-containing protein [Phycisphaeraceae bacterium]|nr:MAG: DUF2752 domain-containing protein [Phycisphaeraceae bacterium]
MTVCPPTTVAHAGLELQKSAAAGVGVRRASLAERVSCGVLASGALALLATAALLDPSPTGTGTHTQLGLPSCTWLAMAGVPCPTCGMTTAFAYAAAGDYQQAFLAQPAGLVFVLATSMAVWIAGHIALFGSTVGRAMTRIFGSRVLWIGLGILLAGWFYKMATHSG